MNNLFVRGLTIDWDEVPRASFLRGIPSIAGLGELWFEESVTLFSGDNQTGKSTLLEAIAVCAGFNAEGGTLNYSFSTYEDDRSELASAVSLVRGFRRPQVGSFLRAESFFNVASAAMTEYNFDGQMEDWHSESHGESFLSFIRKYPQPGLFFMDEPEAALSPRRQVELLEYVEEQAAGGSQFVIVTHSPILLGVGGAQILSFDGDSVHPCPYEETDSYKVTRAFLDRRCSG